MAKKKYRAVANIRMSDEQKDLLKELGDGSLSVGLREVLGFLYRNWEIYEQEKEKQRKLKEYLEGK